MTSAIVAIGTELTDGQIINKNAAWLSSRLKSLGLRPRLHLTVPDDRTLMRESLDIAARHAKWIFLTGGLGPTSDDFTREIVAEWTDRPLEFHPESWDQVVERLSSRGYPIQEFQKQQCSFPQGSVVLRNSQGTANAFRLSHGEFELIVLPGPPREIEAVWMDHLRPWLEQKSSAWEKTRTRSWDTLGLGESQIAGMVAPLISSFASATKLEKALEVGYRVHLPYVEVKLSFLSRSETQLAPLVLEIEKALSSVTVLRDGEDATNLWLKALPTGDVLIQDEVTGSYLQQRLSPVLRSTPSTSTLTWITGPRQKEAASASPKKAQPGLQQFWISPVSETQARVGWAHGTQVRWTDIEAPMKSPLMAERRRQYFAELALLTWLGWFRD